MTQRKSLGLRSALISAVSVSVVAFSVLLVGPLSAQKADLQQRVADLKESTEKNKKALAEYTWVEDVTILVKGQERKTEQFQVRIGADGKPQKLRRIRRRHPRDKDQKQLLSIKIASYLDEPSDAMNLTVDFGRLPDGTSQVSNATVEGVSKQLTVSTRNSDYRKL
jgi:hypothetical protein